jgi:hypothetical protein
MKILRYSGAIVAGIAVAMLLAVAVEFFSALAHPFPEDFDGSIEATCLHVERCPAWVLAVVVPAWAGVAFAGTWTTGRLGNRACALVVGLILLAAVLLNISMLPYPLWFETASVLAIAAAGAGGYRLSGRRAAPAARAGDASAPSL